MSDNEEGIEIGRNDFLNSSTDSTTSSTITNPKKTRRLSFSPQSKSQVNLQPNPPSNIKLMSLCLEILDNEHDLDRAYGETNPLYIYCCNYITDSTLLRTFTDNTYANKLKSINPKDISDKMKNIVKIHRDDFIPAGTSITSTPYNYKESVISSGKSFDDFRKLIRNKGALIGQCLVETYRSGGYPRNSQDNMVNVWRSALTSQFDNRCSWKDASVQLNNAKIIGAIGELNNSNRIYDNYFPKAASVFVYGRQLNKDNVDAIIKLILTNDKSTSVLPFVESELGAIRGELAIFIDYTTLQQIDNDQLWIIPNELYLLHIFKIFNQSVKTSSKAGGGVPQYSFSLQKDQVELNEVSIELYGYNKRGSKFCNILCAPGQKPTSTIDSKMLFSENIPFYMRNCHISYGKLCGDGVTIFAAKKAKFDSGRVYNAVISIDEFCCLRAVYAGIIAAYQQRPSAMAGSGLGILSTTRNHGIYQGGNTELSAADAKALADSEKAQATEKALKDAKALADAVFVQAKRNLTDIITFITTISEYTPFNPVPMYMFVQLFKRGALDPITLASTEPIEINNMVDFCVQYSNILINLDLKNIIFSETDRLTRADNIRMNKLGGLGTLELLLEQFGVVAHISRKHIVYIMITQLFANESFIDNINNFIVKLVDIDFIGAPPSQGSFVEILPNRRLIEDYYKKPFSKEFIKQRYFEIDNAIEPQASYKKLYDNMLTIYNIFNQYNCDENLSAELITEDQCKFKHMLRQRLVIFKYIYRAYITCCFADMIPPQVTSSTPPPSPPREKAIPIETIKYKSWKDINGIANEKINNEYVFINAYYNMINDSEKAILSPSKSPATTADTDEDKLGEVIVDDDYKQGSDDTSCETPPCSGVCDNLDQRDMDMINNVFRLQNARSISNSTFSNKKNMTSKAPRKIIIPTPVSRRFYSSKNETSTALKDILNPPSDSRAVIVKRKTTGKVPSVYSRLYSSARIKGGSRKRKPSKIPRRTIRRRATKHGQKRTIRRQRRNNKRTQKRSK